LSLPNFVIEIPNILLFTSHILPRILHIRYRSVDILCR